MRYQMSGNLDDYDLETLRRSRRLSGRDEQAELLALEALRDDDELASGADQ